jgi:thiol-disulfide isomerase/thioredoxin
MRRTSVVTLAVAAVLLGVGAILYARNDAPIVPTIAAADAAAPGAPWVIKLHAQWCPVCMLTKGMWSEVERHYAGRVRFAVFDFTDEATTAATRVEAERLGLAAALDEVGFATGPVVVLDGRTKNIVAWLDSRDFAEYRDAIDSAIAATEL